MNTLELKPTTIGSQTDESLSGKVLHKFKEFQDVNSEIIISYK
jgi:hypothetical protein